ncbi:MAG: EamA family transporter [Candidatus Tectomicrobia bacterium]|uniref:EamA family transporter n=1 Tax=Tectimicrobiota bacterium TaxID=2528274 RepID=A0A932CPY0_UNCTE|nr:EamA family transporter [Candidatus Tectomicrobia bacterium]
MDDRLIFAILALIMWGLWGFFPKLATDSMSPKSVLIFQNIAAILVAFLVLASVNFKPEINSKGITFSVISGMAGTLGGLFFLYSVSKGKASVAVTITSLYPVITIMLASLILKEPITLKQGIGILFAIIAMVLFSL